MMFLRSLLLVSILHVSRGFLPTITSRRLTVQSHIFAEDQVKKKNAPTHDVRSAAPMDMDPEEAKIQAAFAEHQQMAPKLGWATDVRTLIEYNHGFAVMSTNSKSDPGFPGGSVVGFAPDEDGRPLFIFSGMSTHTQDILADPKCSLTIASKEFKGAADGRVNLMGTAKLVPLEDREKAKEIYLKKHPGAFWVDFGDFNWFRMEIEKIRFVGGFARAGSVTPEDYTNAKPDPISAFGMHIAQHMNEDHQAATIAMIAGQIPGLDVSEAIITSVDSLGMYVKVTRTPRASDQPQQFKLRLPFPRPAADRMDVKKIIVEMTQASTTSK
jgi:putative heme iron utilization protein